MNAMMNKNDTCGCGDSDNLITVLPTLNNFAMDIAPILPIADHRLRFPSIIIDIMTGGRYGLRAMDATMHAHGRRRRVWPVVVVRRRRAVMILDFYLKGI